jgi:hypothetical protein
LRRTKLHELALWAYGDYQVWPDWEVASSMDKARALGFMASLDSFDMFRRQYQNYRAENVMPRMGVFS